LEYSIKQTLNLNYCTNSMWTHYQESYRQRTSFEKYFQNFIIFWRSFCFLFFILAHLFFTFFYILSVFLAIFCLFRLLFVLVRFLIIFCLLCFGKCSCLLLFCGDCLVGKNCLDGKVCGLSCGKKAREIWNLRIWNWWRFVLVYGIFLVWLWNLRA